MCCVLRGVAWRSGRGLLNLSTDNFYWIKLNLICNLLLERVLMIFFTSPHRRQRRRDTNTDGIQGIRRASPHLTTSHCHCKLTLMCRCLMLAVSSGKNTWDEIVLFLNEFMWHWELNEWISWLSLLIVVIVSVGDVLLGYAHHLILLSGVKWWLPGEEMKELHFRFSFDCNSETNGKSPRTDEFLHRGHAFQTTWECP